MQLFKRECLNPIFFSVFAKQASEICLNQCMVFSTFNSVLFMPWIGIMVKRLKLLVFFAIVPFF